MCNKCSVNNLSEYIAAIEDNGLFNSISRGESKVYEYPLRSHIIRSNLRKYNELLDAYHHDVETSITPPQERHFLAFAQHHGIPTNLLDFSFSPLVSLYFSVDGCSDKGLVYFISKDRTININKTITRRPLGWGMLDDLLKYDLELFKDILPHMSESFMKNRERIIEYFETHAEEYIAMFRRRRGKEYLATLEGGVDDFERALDQYRKDKIRWAADPKLGEVTLQIYSSVPDFLAGMEKIYKGDILYPKSFINNYRATTNMFGDVNYRCNIDLLVFLLVMEKTEYWNQLMFDRSEIDRIIEIEFPYYFTYNPPIIDERAKNQSSIFIFQPFSINRYYPHTHVYYWQKMVPDFIIEVCNPEGIRKELDAIGFNLKHIYCDYDSIAKYTIQSV